MPSKKPASMEECVYFTNRTIGSGKAVAWAFRKKCAKCNKWPMSKPQKKSGKIDKKAEHYVCYSCGYEESDEETENNLILNVEYKCSHCGNEGEMTTEYKKKSFYGVKAYVFNCQKCGQKIGITQKLKEPKKMSGFADEE